MQDDDRLASPNWTLSREGKDSARERADLVAKSAARADRTFVVTALGQALSELEDAQHTGAANAASAIPLGAAECEHERIQALLPGARCARSTIPVQTALQ
ncbi:MAG TPA: hypothetical protein VND24_02775 [Steroidobacteraceae bacterium]|nr:hypothetical protein [Steroidobacteraceae bacterium]